MQRLPHSSKPRWRRRAAIAVLLSATALPFAVSPASVRAQPQFDGARMPLLEELDLAPEQRQQIRAIWQDARADFLDRRAELQAERETLQGLLAGTAPVEDIRPQFDRVQTLRQEMATLYFENLLAIRELLTPEQRTLLSDRLSQHRGRDRRRGGGHRSFEGDRFGQPPGLQDDGGEF
ncbi:Spy/CpxP family protein refolding chaperone [Synechococcus sp. PCC 7336]|uniref:Spy/CpxP family protein refolding chaperone n=1 Tax=Synechococcus sp. PCC 7336 TaxID=195250 RepID=UPI0008FBE66D|nr:Spy/CpxP family protein refolding chaperone [Synechococcus sp. PCC 7336]